MEEIAEEFKERLAYQSECWGTCAGAEDRRRDARCLWHIPWRQGTGFFGDQLFELNPGNWKDDSSIGKLPDLDAWKKMLYRSISCVTTYTKKKWLLVPLHTMKIITTFKKNAELPLLHHYQLSHDQFELTASLVYYYRHANKARVGQENYYVNQNEGLLHKMHLTFRYCCLYSTVIHQKGSQHQWIWPFATTYRYFVKSIYMVAHPKMKSFETISYVLRGDLYMILKRWK